MDKIENSVLKMIMDFLDILKKNDFDIKQAYLYGSYANNTHNELSDIDLALVSDDFSGDLWDDRKILRNYKHLVSWDISPLPYREKEFAESKFAQDEIINKGIRIL